MKLRKKFLVILPFFVIFGIGTLFFSVKDFIQKKELGCPCVNLETANGEFVPEEIAYYDDKPVEAPKKALAEYESQFLRVLGDSNGEKWIEVDLSEQKLRAWEGSSLFLETLVSTGKPWTPTPTGEWKIWAKFKYAKMSGGSKENGNYYYLPNVPYIMFFKGDYSLHGTYWHSNFGQQMSHGCVNLPTTIAEKLFYWTNPVAKGNSAKSTTEDPGTRIVIHL